MNIMERKMPEFISGRGGTSFIEPSTYYKEHLESILLWYILQMAYGDQDEIKPFGNK